MTRCDEVRAVAPELALGIVEGEERGLALEHLAECPDCRRRVEELSRQLAQLQQRGTASTAAAAAKPQKCLGAQARSPAWLSAANWRRVRPGMGEFEVIDILGPPSSVRGAPEAQSRTLIYAMEIGSSAFLSGRVDLEDRRVIEVQVPALR